MILQQFYPPKQSSDYRGYFYKFNISNLLYQMFQVIFIFSHYNPLKIFMIQGYQEGKEKCLSQYNYGSKPINGRIMLFYNRPTAQIVCLKKRKGIDLTEPFKDSVNNNNTNLVDSQDMVTPCIKKSMLNQSPECESPQTLEIEKQFEQIKQNLSHIIKPTVSFKKNSPKMAQNNLHLLLKSKQKAQIEYHSTYQIDEQKFSYLLGDCVQIEKVRRDFQKLLDNVKNLKNNKTNKDLMYFITEYISNFNKVLSEKLVQKQNNGGNIRQSGNQELQLQLSEKRQLFKFNNRKDYMQQVRKDKFKMSLYKWSESQDKLLINFAKNNNENRRKLMIMNRFKTMQYIRQRYQLLGVHLDQATSEELSKIQQENIKNHQTRNMKEINGQ